MEEEQKEILIESPLDSSQLFATHNDLIEKFSLNLLSEREEDILMIIVSELQKNREFTKVSLKKIKQLLDKTMTYKKLISEIEGLSKKSLVLLTGQILNNDGSVAAEEGDIWIPIIFSSLIIHKNEKAVSVKFNSEIEYIFWDLKDRFFISNVEHYLKLKGKKQKIFYRFFKRWENYENIKITITVERLKKILKCPETYQYKSLKKVINLAVENVNKHTDIFVEFLENKKGRTVISIDFKISNIGKKMKKGQAKKITDLNELYDQNK